MSGFMSIIAVRIYRYASAWCELSPHLYISWFHKLYQVFHNDIHAVLVKIAVVSEAEKIQLK